MLCPNNGLHRFFQVMAYTEGGSQHRMEVWACENCGLRFQRYWDAVNQRWEETEESKVAKMSETEAPKLKEYLVWSASSGQAVTNAQGVVILSMKPVGFRTDTPEEAVKMYASDLEIKQSLKVCVCSVVTGDIHTYEVEPVIAYKVTGL